ncbi:MAG: hypothetical protein ACFE0J_15470 [Elainellaceae cyanobacterium]
MSFQDHPAMNNTLSKAFRSFAPVATLSFSLLGFALPVEASEIENVSPDVFQCMKEHNSNERGYLSFPSENSGTIDAYSQVLDIWGGSVDFNYDSTSETLTLTNPQCPGGERIEEGLRDVAQQCINGKFD